MLRLYDKPGLSGNVLGRFGSCMTQLGIPLSASRSIWPRAPRQNPAFRAKSRFARVPVLELEDGLSIVESAVIMLSLARPAAVAGRSVSPRGVTSWLTFEQADLLRALALPRFYHARHCRSDGSRIGDFQEGAYLALGQAGRVASYR